MVGVLGRVGRKTRRGKRKGEEERWARRVFRPTELRSLNLCGEFASQR